MEKKSCQHNTRPFKQVNAFTIMFSSFDKEIFFSKQTACCSKFIKNMFSILLKSFFQLRM